MGTLLIFLFCPETSYRRPDVFNIDLGTVDHTRDPISEKEAEMDTEPPWTIWQQLRLFRGIESDDNFFKIITRPFPLLLFPQVMYAFITALSTSWLSVLIGITALIFGSPPYNFSVSELGLLGIGGLIASLLGFSAGPLNDWLCKFMARRNGGIYEPEVLFDLDSISADSQFRLVTMFFTFVFGTIGFFGFGISLHYQLPWIVPFAFECIIIFGLSFLGIAIYGYITDCLRDHAPEAFASLNLANLYEFGIIPCLNVVFNSRTQLFNCAMVFRSRTPCRIFNNWSNSHFCHGIDNSNVHVWKEGKKLDSKEEIFPKDCFEVDIFLNY